MNIAKLIDHTILKANTTKEDVMKVIEEAKEYKFKSFRNKRCYRKRSNGS